MAAVEPKRVAIACQGGGSHTAFTAGVLTRLFEDGLSGHEVVGLSGTSGGAVCALLTWYALRQNDAPAVGRLLEAFWSDNSAQTPWDQFVNASVMAASELQEFMVMPAISPYDNFLAEVGARDFKRLLERRVDFDALAPGPDESEPLLLIGSVDVLSGEFRAFDSRRDRISAETILASAAIPTLFEAVHLDGGIYWDGLFSQNPPIRELLDVSPDEIWVIQINPSQRELEPQSTLEIADRRNELAGNLSLYQELHFIEKIDELLETQMLSDETGYRNVVVRIIELSPSRVPHALSVRSKLNRDSGFIRDLIAHGRTQAEEFLTALRFEQAWRARDTEAMLSFADDAVELVATAPFPAARSVRGRDRVAAYLAEHLSTMTLDATRKQVAREAVTWSLRTRSADSTTREHGRAERGRAEVTMRDGRITSVRLGPGSPAT